LIKFVFLIIIGIFLIYGCENNPNEIKSPTINIERSNGDYKVLMNAGTYGVIFYTEDGTTPSKNSTRYFEPITVKEGSLIKAISLCPSGKKSKVIEIVINKDSITINKNIPVSCK
jgi:hypothetical protein